MDVLQRQRRYDEAVALLRRLLQGRYCRGRRGWWWARLAINLETGLGRKDAALQVGV